MDGHPLTLIDADGTYLEPTPVAGVVIAVAQRYSVLLHANATASPNATYWMRSSVQSDMFTYDQPGQNLDIRGIIRYLLLLSSLLNFQMIIIKKSRAGTMILHLRMDFRVILFLWILVLDLI